MKQQHTVCLCVVFLSGRFKDCCVLVDSERNAKVINRLVFLFGGKKKFNGAKKYLGYLLKTSLLRFQQSGAVSKSNSSTCVMMIPESYELLRLCNSLWLPAGQEHRARTPLTPLHSKPVVLFGFYLTFGKRHLPHVSI